MAHGRRGIPEHEVDEELRFHLEQRTRDYIARGMSPEAAREAAAERFGDPRSVREACTSVLPADRAAEARRALVSVSWLDVKLGLRMFAKYPGLSLVAVGGMAIAIAFGAGYFALVGSFLDSRVPIDRGDRVVMIRNRSVPGPDAAGAGRIDDVGPAAFDLRQWQDRVKSVVELSAFRDDKRNLITEDGQVQLVRVATITASGLRLTRGAGVAAGLTTAGILEWVTPGGNVGGHALILFPTVSAVMFAVGLLAAAGPARRGLAIEPTESLRAE